MSITAAFQMNRRRMLLALAAASWNATALPASADASTAENPELIRLAAELPAVAAAYHDFDGPYQAEYDAWQRRTPWAPDELTEKTTCHPHESPTYARTEMKVLGGYLWRQGDEYPRQIVLSPWGIETRIRMARKRKRNAKKAGRMADYMAAEAEIAHLVELAAKAEAYQERYDAVKAEAEAWSKAATPIRHALHEALEKHIAAIMDQPDHTMEGLIIKAQALAEWDRVGTRYFDRVAFKHGQNWHGQIAASILKHAGGAAA